MNTYDFQKKCKEWLRNYYSENFDINLGIEDIYVVWAAKVLQNNKVLLKKHIPTDDLYVECTYNGEKQETYIDIYYKEKNIVVDMK